AKDGAEPAGNSRLRLAIQRARDANMPIDTIERAIKRGAGAGEGAEYHEIAYEGYGPHGVAILVEAMTDNRNRAAAEIRSTFNRGGGNLGESGSVRWLFDSRGVVTAEVGTSDPDEIALLAIDAGADDVQIEDSAIDVYTEPGQLEAVRQKLEESGVQVVDSQLAMVAKTNVALEGQAAEQTIRLIERLEELDDVQQVYSNLDIPAELAASLAG
ncbi:MAG: YebC/PmpR family DNA-binding transcriptional regulator, partial [Chloroflexota bacterium]|nr:YebC/PmpR family DNA-binding transcriptional regulator [Chloroflexota bacterium]